MVEKKPKGYWMSLDNVVAEAKKVMKDNDLEEFPGSKALYNMGHSDLINAIHKYQGGFRKFRELLGQKQKRTEDGLLKNQDYILREVKKIKKRYGWDILPNSSVLLKKGHSGLINAIQRYHGGFHKFRELLGEKQRKRINGQWKDIYYTFREANRVMKKYGWEELPTQLKLEEKGEYSLVGGINRYHGGFIKFKKIMWGTEARLIKPKDYWDKIDNVVVEAKKAMEEQGWEELPSSRILYNEGYSGLVHAIHRYHGGFHKFRELLGQKQKRTEKGRWDSLDYTLEHAREAMEKEGWEELPAPRKLVEMKYFGLINAINKYHNGFIIFRAKLNEHLGRKSEREQLEDLLKRYAD